MKKKGTCAICRKKKMVEQKTVLIKEIGKRAISKDTFCDECFLRTKPD